jgi:hypothetical protein
MKSIVFVLSLVIASSAAAQPRVTNGDVRQTASTGALTRASLDGLARASGTAWLAYAVPLVPGDRSICDGITYTDSAQVHQRENKTGSTSPPVMMLEGPRALWVLYRLEDGAIRRIRMASEDCTLDAGGLAVHWIAGVTPADSVAVLSSFLVTSASRRLTDGALAALAMHAEPAALERLMTAARGGETPHVRGQALFWLAQRAGEKAIGTISDAIANDPETDVKRRAVFALSQLPRDEGVPRLIDVARSNSNPVVRKQAMFWLGQSKDPRALKFFEEILFK